jgi:hypothetical protein
VKGFLLSSLAPCLPARSLGVGGQLTPYGGMLYALGSGVRSNRNEFQVFFSFRNQHLEGGKDSRNNWRVRVSE